MEKHISSFLKKGMWVAAILCIIRCAISFEDIKTNPSFYSIFGYIGEAISLAAILMVAYEKWLWRINPFSGIPCIKGTYSGNIKSSFDSKVRKANLEVKQTFLSIKIIMTTDESTSTSVFAIIDNQSDINELIYTYRNEPKAEYRPNSSIHYGTARLRLVGKGRLVGQYYTDRQTLGDLNFDKKTNR